MVSQSIVRQRAKIVHAGVLKICKVDIWFKTTDYRAWRLCWDFGKGGILSGLGQRVTTPSSSCVSCVTSSNCISQRTISYSTRQSINYELSRLCQWSIISLTLSLQLPTYIDQANEDTITNPTTLMRQPIDDTNIGKYQKKTPPKSWTKRTYTPNLTNRHKNLNANRNPNPDQKKNPIPHIPRLPPFPHLRLLSFTPPDEYTYLSLEELKSSYSFYTKSLLGLSDSDWKCEGYE